MSYDTKRARELADSLEKGGEGFEPHRKCIRGMADEVDRLREVDYLKTKLTEKIEARRQALLAAAKKAEPAKGTRLWEAVAACKE